MKLLKLKYLFIFITLCPLLSFSQEKKDNLIIVTPGDTTNLYDRIINLLTTEGYKFDKSQRKGSYVCTKYRSIGKYGNSLCYYDFNIKGNTVSVRGYWNFDNMLHKATYKYGFTPAWDEMDRLAKMLGTVTYSKEK